MNTRLIGCLVAAIGMLARLGVAQSTLPTTQPANAMDLASIVFEWTKAELKPEVEGTPPLFVIGGWKPSPTNCRHYYSMAVNGRAERGTRHVVGYLGGPFPEGSTIVAESFGREGKHLTLVLRFDEKPSVPPVRKGSVCYFAATLDPALPEGTYQVTVELKNLTADVDAQATQRIEFQKPDPLLTQLKAERELLKTVSQKDLVDRYCEHAAQMKGMGVPYEDLSMRTAVLVWDVETERLAMLKREIVSRGSAIGPLLIAELKDHAARNAELERSASPPRGIARELMDMLAQIGDARAAPVMLDLLSGKTRCNRFVSQSAVEHIEKLTHVRFRKFDPHNTSYADAVRGRDATVDPHKEESRVAFARELAGKYERFFRQYPAKDADATPWAKQAVRMARVWLGSDDLPEAYNAATFLRSGRYRPRIIDDSPARTTDQIAEILEQCEVVGSEKSEQGVAYYTYRHKPTGQVLPVTVYNWADLLTSGPSVSPQYAGLLIRLDREMPDYPGGMANYLFKIGGTEAMAYRIEAYKRLLVEINKAGNNPTTDISSKQDRALQPTVRHCQFFRWGIERWAGRTFATDADLDAWWSAEKDKTQQQWLETGLPITAAKADSGDRQSQYLLRLMLGDALPHAPNHFVWLNPGSSSDPPPRAESIEPFRVKWLSENADRFRCDAERGIFVAK